METKNQFKRIPMGRFQTPKKCYFCGGSGLEICGRCCGNKTVNGSTCPDCGGRGTIKCPACRGTGIYDD